MKCSYCGKELSDGSKICDGCGAKIDSVDTQQQDNINGQNNLNLNKSNKSSKLIIIVIILVTLLLIGLGVFFLINGNKKESKENSKPIEDNTNEKIDNNKAVTKLSDISYEESITKENVLPTGQNKTECVLIPNELQDVNSYTFEIYGTGDITIYGMERVDRTHTR